MASFHFLRLNDSIVCVYHLFFIHSTIGHLGCSRNMAIYIVNNAALNIRALAKRYWRGQEMRNKLSSVWVLCWFRQGAVRLYWGVGEGHGAC